MKRRQGDVIVGVRVQCSCSFVSNSSCCSFRLSFLLLSVGGAGGGGVLYS